MRRSLVWMLIVVLMPGIAACGGEKTGTRMPEPRVVKITPRNTGDLRVMLGGDTMFDDLALPWLMKYGWSYSLAGVAPLLRQADLVNLNLETAVAAECKRSYGHYAYYMPPEALAGLVNSGVQVVTLANNHVFDCGEKGLTATIQNVEKAGLAHYGGGVTEEEANRPLIVELGNTKIGFLGMYDYGTGSRKKGTAVISEANVRGLIHGLRSKVDVLLVVFHWGTNYVKDFDNKQKKFGRLALAEGADVVIGHHPHIPQAVELYKDKPLIYSLGNFAFGTGNNQAQEGLLAELVLSGKKIKKVLFYPLFLQNRDEKVRWQTQLAQGERGQKTMKNIMRMSGGLGGKMFIRDDHLELAVK